MKDKLYAALRYIVLRLQEASAWRGVVLLLAVAGANLSEEHKELIVLLGLGVSGLIGFLMPDQLNRDE